MNTGSLKRAIRFAIGGAAVLIAPGMTTIVSAQDTSEAAEEVVVTGSRIARGSDFESPAPVITVDHESIEKSGYNNLQQLMEKMPVSGQRHVLYAR